MIASQMPGYLEMWDNREVGFLQTKCLF